MNEKWNLIPLGECAEIIMGQSPKGDSYNNQGIGVPLINGPADYGSIHPEPKQWTTQPTKLCVPGDIIFCVRASVGKLNLANKSCCIGRGVAAIRGKKNISITPYLMHVLAFHEYDFIRIAKGSGTTFPNLTSKELAKHLIPLPSISEQERISNTLSSIDKEINQVGVAIEESERIKCGLMQKFMNGMWESVRLENVISLISGRDLLPNQYSDKEIGVPYITGASNVVCGKIMINRWTDTPVSISDIGDILITCKGTVGLTAYNTIGVCHIARQLMALRPNMELIDMHYLKFAVDGAINHLLHLARSMIPGISRKDILDLKIPLPPLREQQHISSILLCSDNIILLQNKRKSLLEAIKRGMMQQLLSGVDAS